MSRFLPGGPDRVVIEDPIFGTLKYHKKLINNNFDGSQHLCRLPFTYAEVRRNGDVNLCCPNWSPAIVGNIFETSIEQIWTGDRAWAVRNSILDGSYRYCNWDTCSLIRNNRLHPKTPDLSKELMRSARASTPCFLHFVVDYSCNLACPSCRIRKIPQLSDDEKDQGYRAITQTLDIMFAQTHKEHKILSMDGSGEIFSSELYRQLFETHPVFTQTDQWPNLRFRLTTNGTMMTAKIQRRYHHIMQHLENLEVSVDAGNPESYARVRVGGHWNLLWDNLRNFHDNTLLAQPYSSWNWNIIIQKNNYESLPELIDIAETFTKQPTLLINEVLNWGTWSESDYLDHAVHLLQHPEHSKYREIINSSKVVKYIERQKSRHK